ncbi:MAG: DUF2058 domain-containing protein [Gammaproteobacteria bacterium]|nr:MAG: DUF2058 domain-containing protein [Gammaproteobacteria bacterium]RLA21438.1 MAG: DUF2058 domain-containing protein [Gammaproteobacteria bacterium]
MAGSLQDQLLNIGVADKKKSKKAKHDKRQDATKSRQARKSGVKATPKEIQQQLDKARQDKQQKDLALNQQRNSERAEKALVADVRQIIVTQAVEIPKEAEVAYHFEHDKKVKKLYVTDEQQKQLTRGQLAIAIIDDGYRLIPDKMAEKIESRLANMVIRIQSESVSEEDDPYADYQIPDDLMW